MLGGRGSHGRWVQNVMLGGLVVAGPKKVGRSIQKKGSETMPGVGLKGLTKGC